MLTTKQKWGIAALVGGVAAAGVAVALYRRRPAGGSVMGKAVMPPSVGKTKAGGMTTTHYRREGEMPIQERVGILQDLVAKAVKDPRMRKLALEVTKNCPARDGECESRQIYNFVRSKVRYTGDVGAHALSRGGPVEPIDLFQHPLRTVEFGGGDCDDHSALSAALAILNGLQARFRITAPTSDPHLDDWGHIYTLIGLPKETPRKWVAVDSTLPGENFGREAPKGKHSDWIA